MKRTPIPVLVALDNSVISRTKKIVGIFRAAAESGLVELRILNDGRDLTASDINKAAANGVGGFIIGATGTQAAIRRVQRLHLPLAVISQPCTVTKQTVVVMTGNEQIAGAAASALCSTPSCRTFAFFPPKKTNANWAIERERAFFAKIKNRGYACIRLPRAETVATLLRLPRPFGVFAAHDSCAAELVNLCKNAGIRIPEEATIIGVDNDISLCENTTPSLSSIEPDFEREGYEAARAVIRMLSGIRTPHLIRSELKQIVERKSTSPHKYAESLVSRAQCYIAANAVRGITVSDVAAHLNVSRRLLDLRFHELAGKSVLKTIIDYRLAHLQKELRNTTEPIASLCRKCGFGSENHPKKLFRQRFGQTMSEYRSN